MRADTAIYAPSYRASQATSRRPASRIEESGIVDRTELPPPIARTVYTLSEVGWQKVPPVIQAIATFGLDLIDADASAFTPLNGFLAGILLAFDSVRGKDLHALSDRHRRSPLGSRCRTAISPPHARISAPQ